MSDTFPFGLSGATAQYASLFVLTWALHIAAVGYLLGGTGVAAAAALARAPADGALGRLGALLRDWLPFALGAAITAGVAPILLAQVLYQENFYSAQLLLADRWMALVPVLIAAFYGLYLLKSERVARWRAAPRAALALAVLATFSAIAVSFSENHLLSLDRAAWPALYGEQARSYDLPAALLRASIWMAAALPVMAALAARQLRGLRAGDAGAGAGSEAADAGTGVARLLAALAVAGLCGAVLAGALYWPLLSEAARAALVGPPGRAWAILLGVAVLVQLAAWVRVLLARAFESLPLALAGGGAVVALLSAAALREVARLAYLDLGALAARHAQAAQAGGFSTFVLFAAVNGGLIVWVLRVVGRR